MKVFSKYSKEDYATMGLFFLAFAGFAISQQICVFLYVPTRPVSIGFRLILLCFCSFFIFRQVFGSRTIYKGFLLPIFLIWAFIYIVRVAIYCTENVQTLHPSGVYLQMLIGMCLLPCLGFMYVWDERRLKIGLYSVSIGSAISGWGYCFLYRASIFGDYGMTRVKGGEWVGDYIALNAIQLGYAGSALLVLTFGMFSSRITGKWRWVALAAIALPGLLLINFSASRGPLLALIFCILLYALANFRLRHILRFVWGSLIILIIIFLGIGYSMLTESELIGRFEETYYAIVDGDDGTSISRLNLYSLAWEEFLEAPLLGNFVELRLVSMYPHNFFMEALHATGLLGFSIFVTLVIGALIIGLRLIRNHPEASWVSLLYFHFFFYGQLSGALYSSSFFWLSLGLLLGVWQAHRYGYLGSTGAFKA